MIRHRFAPIATALATFAVTTAASAQTLPQPLASPAPATCAQRGGATLIGRVPMPRRGQNVALQIAPDSIATEALAKDMIAEVDVMKPLESHMANFKEYSTALAQMPVPTPSLSERSLDAVAAVLAEQAAHKQLTTLAMNELSDVPVGATGDFTCRGVPAGAYIFILSESELIPTTPAQQTWGSSLPNKTLYVLRFVVPNVPKAAPYRLRAPFTMVARFRPVGA